MNYGLSKADKLPDNKVFQFFQGFSELMKGAEILQDDEALKEFYFTLKDFIKWKENPKIKSALAKTDLIFRSVSGASTALSFPKVPFGLRPLITEASILKEKYFTYFKENQLIFFPLSAYLTLLSSAYSSSKSSSTPSDIVKETIQVLPAYFNALMEFNVEAITEDGYPEINYILNREFSEDLEKVIEYDQKRPEGADRRLYLIATQLAVSQDI